MTTEPTSDVKAARILVVDDEAVPREIIGQLLKAEGYVVELADDGVTALECVHAVRPDVIVLNLMMPRMNGLQCLRVLRAEPAHAKLPVIMTTAWHGFSVDSATLGDTEVVYMPFHAESLLDKVALAVDRSRDPNKRHTRPIPAASESQPPKDRGVIMFVEHDCSRLQQLDAMLTERGYTVVSMTRPIGKLSPLVRALRPRAIVLDWVCQGVANVMRELPDYTVHVDRQRTLLVFSRTGGTHTPGTLEYATDGDLVGLIESQRDRPQLA